MEVTLKDDTSTIKAHAYIAGENVNAGYTLPMRVPPSEVFDGHTRNAVNNGIWKTKQFQYARTIQEITRSNKQYKHPSSVLQLSLEALCVEMAT